MKGGQIAYLSNPIHESGWGFCLFQVETWFSDLKEFGGAKFVMTADQKIEGQTFQTIKFTNIELNVTIDEKVFDKQ